MRAGRSPEKRFNPFHASVRVPQRALAACFINRFVFGESESQNVCECYALEQSMCQLN